MAGNSRFISSAQSGPHDDLAALVHRHLDHPFRKPILDYNRQAFSAALAARDAWNSGAPLVLDAGCGVGWSTLRLAERYPDHFVIGVDQSSDRISRGKPLSLPANAHFQRADLVDFWRLLDEAGVRLARHYVLYPNPWPKIGHLARRWHGHAVFPDLLALGGDAEAPGDGEDRRVRREAGVPAKRRLGRPVGDARADLPPPPGSPASGGRPGRGTCARARRRRYPATFPARRESG